MNEDNKENEMIKTGLDPSDTKDYDVSAGSRELMDPVQTKSSRKKSSAGATKGVAAFTAGFIACLAVLFVLSYVFGAGRFLSRKQYESYLELTQKYGKYDEILQMIEDDPIAEYDAEDISDTSLKELVAGIGDPYAEYYTAEEYEEFRKRYMGDYVGIGISVTDEDGKVVIKSVMEDSPAQDIGLQAEDVIKAIDGKQPADVDEAVDLISGDAGTKVELTIERAGETFDVTATRARIEAESVYYKEYEDEEGGDTNIGYIWIAAFRKNTARDFKLAVKDLKNEGCDRFIIDLRDNGGGLTDESIEIADYLLPECRIMSEKTKSGKETVYNSKAGSAGITYVLLVNGNTASASEILSAAVQDNKGGTIIGTKTYGKGVTQLSRRFSDGSAIKITTTEYFRPSGGKVNGVGITPDIEAEGNEVIEKALEELGK